MNLHYHFIVLEGVYLDRSAQGLKPKFVKIAPPSDADIATVVTKITWRPVMFRILASHPGASPAGGGRPASFTRPLGARPARLDLGLTLS